MFLQFANRDTILLFAMLSLIPNITENSLNVIKEIDKHIVTDHKNDLDQIL